MYKLRCDLDELSSYFYKSIYGVINKNTLINVSKYLHDSGKGYRTIAKLLNGGDSRTAKNREWKNTNVYAVLKRYAERQARLERQSYTSEMKFSKMKLEWLKD